MGNDLDIVFKYCTTHLKHILVKIGHLIVLMDVDVGSGNMLFSPCMSLGFQIPACKIQFEKTCMIV